MASIEKRGSAYRIFAYNGYDVNGRQIRKTMTYKPKAKSPGAIKKEVMRAAVEFENKVKHKEVVDEHVRFAKFYGIWKEEWAEDHLSSRTYQDYCRHIDKKAIPVIGNKVMDKITNWDIQSLINEMKQTYQPASIHKVISAIDSVFRYAYLKRVIIENPVERCSMPSIKRRQTQFFNAKQTKLFLNAIQAPYKERRTRKGKIYYEYGKMQYQLQLYFFVAVYSGFRRGEMISLTWNDVDFSNHTIQVTKATSTVRDTTHKVVQVIKEPKTQSGYRTVMIPDCCFEMLAKWRIQEEQLSASLGDSWKGFKDCFDKNFIFIQSDGSQMSIWTPDQALKRFIKRYNDQCINAEDELPDIRLHDLRHTNATLLLGNGVDIETVAKRLGHRKASTTLDIYGHALADKDAGASEKLAELLG